MMPAIRTLNLPGKRLMSATAVIAVEVWLAAAPDVLTGDLNFQLLCALSCWVPAWLCGDLLSIHHRGSADPHREWAPREFLALGWLRLRRYLRVLALWAGTWTARALAAAYQTGSRPFFSITKDAAWIPYSWLAWTTVFLASATAYASAAALLSALSRRPRRWLLVPMLVVPVSVCALLGAELILGPQFNRGGAAAVIENPVQVVTSPNNLLGATVALGLAGRIDDLPDVYDPYFEAILGQGIAPFAWLGALFYTVVTALATAGAWSVAKQRNRRHPRTADPPVISAEALPGQREG